jgi:hypothetical protein
MKKVLRLFLIKREERPLALAALLVLAALHTLVICHYYHAFTPITDNAWAVFVSRFNISGFDPITYDVVTHWSAKYNVYRHPLLAFFMFIPYLLNQALMAVTGINCALFIVAAILLFCGFYSVVFIYRIGREIIGLRRADATLLAALLFSFAYIMLSAVVPDHFILSMMMLLLTLYVAGLKLRSGRPFTIAEGIALFVVTAGISLNNGLKIFLAGIFTRWFSRDSSRGCGGTGVRGNENCRGHESAGVRGYENSIERQDISRTHAPTHPRTSEKITPHLRYLLLAIIIPAALMWLFARWEYRTFVWPKEMAAKEAKAKRNKQLTEKIYRDYADTAKVKDSAAVEAGVKRIVQQRARAKYLRDRQKVWNRNTGKPIAKGEFSRWTDISTPRGVSIVENLFGESIQLHPDHLLQDTLRARPVIVNYRWAVCYVVEAIIVALFLIGIWCGRRSRFLWLALAFFALDMVLHVGLGFGLNEVFIMAAHWLFILPIAIGYLVKKSYGQHAKPLWALRTLLLLLTLYLWAYNLTLFISFLAA